jgi:hypothetical protein
MSESCQKIVNCRQKIVKKLRRITPGKNNAAIDKKVQ